MALLLETMTSHWQPSSDSRVSQVTYTRQWPPEAYSTNSPTPRPGSMSARVASVSITAAGTSCCVVPVAVSRAPEHAARATSGISHDAWGRGEDMGIIMHGNRPGLQPPGMDPRPGYLLRPPREGAGAERDAPPRGKALGAGRTAGAGRTTGTERVGGRTAGAGAGRWTGAVRGDGGGRVPGDGRIAGAVGARAVGMR